LRRAARQAASSQHTWPVLWKPDYNRPASFRFKGYAAVQRPSQLGNYLRLAYDRNQPWERDIAWFNRCVVELAVSTPRSYLIPQAWREVINRLQWNGVVLERLAADQVFNGQAYLIDSVESRPRTLRRPYVPRRRDFAQRRCDGEGPCRVMCWFIWTSPMCVMRSKPWSPRPTTVFSAGDFSTAFWKEGSLFRLCV
jgi:hypothetical protein